MWKTFLAVLLVAASASVIGNAGEALDVHFINVGAGDAILIDYGDWEALLDAGPGFAATNAALLAVLAEHVEDRIIELAILSHPHADHYGGFAAVFASYKVLQFWRSLDTTPDSSGPTYASFLSALMATGLTPRLLKRGDTVSPGQLEWSVLGPNVLKKTPADENDNDNSLVLLLTKGSVHFLFPGDIEDSGEAALLATDPPLGVLVLKVPHHGSHTSASVAFLDWAVPDVAVISTKYEEPPVLDTLRDMSVPVFLTSEVGSITISTDGSTWTATASTGVLAAMNTGATSPEGRLFLTVVPVSATGQGNTATLRALTLPGAACSITVYYGSGPSTAAGLGNKLADTTGSVSWSWKVGTRTAPGMHRIVVSVSLNGHAETQTAYFEVIDTGSPG